MQAFPPFVLGASALVAELPAQNVALGLAVPVAGDTLCLVIGNPALVPGQDMAIVASSEDTTVWQARIVVRTDRCDQPAPEEEEFTYLLAVPRAVPFGIYFGVLGNAGRIRIRDGRLVAHFDRREPEDEFEVCASAEGLHLTVWNGPMSRGQRIWHRYHYLGFDLEPDCTGVETGE